MPAMLPAHFAVAAPDFTRALVPAPSDAHSGAAPDVAERIRVLQQAADRATLLREARALLLDLLGAAACPDDFLRIARLIGCVETELRELAPPAD
ncbi:hypothetical protein [Longimicrobium sp.]|uniref:hypothetical protein n=1 Tax=Longimicrobium sp. TaxID=2029185 RepID=UPI002E2EC4A9|nr:hypothetical protein [Longimicrobium sp.]HEX6039209.1 hypothetical protein [Longimicrobium sp.]